MPKHRRKGKTGFLTQVLATYRKPERQGFEDAWVGLEPTFQTRRNVELYAELEDDDERYFVHPWSRGLHPPTGGSG